MAKYERYDKEKHGEPIYELVIEAAAEEMGQSTYTEKEQQVSQAMANSFAQGLAAANTKTLQVRVKRAEKSGINALSPLHLLEREFILSRKAKGNSPKTVKAYEDNFIRLYDFIGYANFAMEENREAAENTNLTERRLGQITPIVVLETDNFVAYFREYLTKVRLVSIYTAESTIRHYRAIAYYAMDQGWIRKEKIPLLETKPPIKATLGEREMERLAKKPPVSEFVAYRTWVMIHYFASTGNRISSALGLMVEDIDFENRTVTIAVNKDRTPKQMPLLLPLARVLREYVLEYRSDDEGQPLTGEPLFCNRFGEALAYRSVYDAFADYYAARGLEWNGFHKYRHSYAANWVRKGGNAFMLKEQLGHSTLEMTNRYANIYGLATREEAEAFSLSRELNPKTGRKTIKRKG